MMTKENKKLYDEIKKQKDFKIDHNGKLIDVSFTDGFVFFDNVKINLDMYNKLQSENDYLDMMADIKNCLSYTLKTKDCSVVKSKIKSIA